MNNTKNSLDLHKKRLVYKEQDYNPGSLIMNNKSFCGGVINEDNNCVLK